MHLEAGHSKPFHNSWHVYTLLKDTKRFFGASHKKKLPITTAILLKDGLVDLSSSLDVTFWACCLVAFFSLFRKSNQLVKSMSSFDPSIHLCRKDALFSVDGVSLTVRWSKPMQYKQRVQHIRLPRIPSSPLCPAYALVLSLHRCSTPPFAPLFSYLGPCGWLPLSASLFQRKLSQCLATLQFNPAEYSGNRFRRGGATFALECGLPVDVIKAQGDWASNSYERYSNPSWSMRKHLAATPGKHVVQVTGPLVS